MSRKPSGSSVAALRRGRLALAVGQPNAPWSGAFVELGEVGRAVSTTLRQPDSAFTVATPRW